MSTRGGLSHLTGEYLKAASGMDLAFINYPGTAQTLTDIVGGRVPMSVESLSALIGPATGGEIRILAVASAHRLPTLPKVPTVAETVPGFEATAWFVLVAPKGTPPDVVDKISKDVHAILSENAIRDQMLKLSTFIKDVPLPELPAFIAAQRKKWSPIVEKFAVKTK